MLKIYFCVMNRISPTFPAMLFAISVSFNVFGFCVSGIDQMSIANGLLLVPWFFVANCILLPMAIFLFILKLISTKNKKRDHR